MTKVLPGPIVYALPPTQYLILEVLAAPTTSSSGTRPAGAPPTVQAINGARESRENIVLPTPAALPV
jgi:hypothetical protein